MSNEKDENKEEYPMVSLLVQVRSNEKKILKSLAETYTKGNVSAMVRWLIQLRSHEEKKKAWDRYQEQKKVSETESS